MNSGYHAEKRGRRLVGGCLEFIVTVIVVIAVAFALREFVVEPYKVPSGSMEDTIETGDMILAEKLSYNELASSVLPMFDGDVSQGDIVTFADPENSSRTLIKRVIAVGGQTVNLVDGMVYIDGEVLVESYVDDSTWPLATASDVVIEYPYTVPEGYLWVMGDNRDNSSDSRYFGPIPESSVTARAFFVYWPLADVGLLS